MFPDSSALLPSSSAPRVSVVVVTWNGLHLLQPCVAALQAQTQAHELVIVDNGSQDGTVAWVRAYLPDAHLVALPSNTGFAAGNNAGIAAATGDLVVLLNNDTVAAPDALTQLVAPFAANPQLGAVAGVLTFAHRPELVASAGIVVGRDLVHRDLWATEAVATLPSTPVPIFGASGGAVCYRRAALDEVGLFDPHFFAYLEDADLAWRLRLQGWETVLAPAAHIAHVYSATGRQDSPFKQRLLARNRWRVIVRCVPLPLLLRCLLAVLLYDALAIVYAILKRQPAIAQGRWAALRTFPQLLRERHRIQARRTVAVADLARWLTPSLSVRATLREARALHAVLAER